MFDITHDELMLRGTREGDTWVLRGTRYHINILARWEDGAPRRTILTICDCSARCAYR